MVEILSQGTQAYLWVSFGRSKAVSHSTQEVGKWCEPEGPAGQVPVDVLEGLESYGYSHLQLAGAILM